MQHLKQLTNVVAPSQIIYFENSIKFRNLEHIFLAKLRVEGLMEENKTMKNKKTVRE